MKEAVTRVHVVNLQLFLWDDTPENVVPTCCCSANRNCKDCCAGIMFALQHRKEFKDWFGTCFTKKKELMSRRLRADCDPVLCHARLFFPFDSPSPRQFIDIAHIRLQPRPLAALPHTNAHAKEEAAVVLTGLQVQARISLLGKLVLDVGSDQFLVSRVHLYTFVHDIPVCPCLHLTYFHDSCKRYRLVLMEY